MCICTHYDGQCGHSWISNSQPCGPLRDFLNCPNHVIAQYLVAPPGTCPVCCGGFADPETIQMVQGPWGCNQMLRNQMGIGNHMIPGDWGVDHRLVGPMAGPVGMPGMGGMAVGMPMAGPVAMPAGMPMGLPVASPYMVDQGMVSESFHDDGYGISGVCYNGGRGRNRRSSHHYREYRHKERSGPGCTVM